MEKEAKSFGCPVFNGNVTFIGPVYFQSNIQEKLSQKQDADNVDLHVQSSDMEKYTKHFGEPDIYQIVSEPKGIVLILNNEFKGQENERIGSSYDIWRMVELWRQIGLRVVISKDQTGEEMLTTVKDFVKCNNIPDIGLCVVILMSHGQEGDLIVGRDDSQARIEDIAKCIQDSELLKGKPKLLCVQMCRGPNAEKVDHIDSGAFSTSESTWFKSILTNLLPGGVDIDKDSVMIDITPSGDNQITPSGDNQINPQHVTMSTDMMIAFATQPGHVSFRTNTGTWFITAIAKVFAEYAKDKDLRELMYKVKEKVKKNVSNMPNNPAYHNCTATIEIQDTLEGKRLYFFPGCPDPNM